ncbi:antitoxin Xre/MbcA/ParS toxin-binding domain-containing protein [Pseudomonas lactucae]|uniref:DUF2384 domain-containing protein n=1 Tax=Pseudomonas lactucae TaxID=2813360 RepID=A0A9X0YBU9_9PSED|nr:antitoxin Xre/MbcA/ParS toxin-binding domain-containing protein [Pseudomonas lactucae]MBN2976404.1 DUF2384 domain-containing protein [Pseudomonas lactucae]MBN2987381.1 DUF2384 domain-containing protein [Pseudomonas lactucae]
MVTPAAQPSLKAKSVLKPTECLTRAKAGQLSQLDIFLLVKEGFALKNVQAMLSISELYSSADVTARVLGKSLQALRRRGHIESARLDAQQSAIAYQYAKALEHATSVFGTQKHAEEWLSHPCKYLAGGIPVELIGNSLGFRAVEDYLKRVEYGVYQ